MNSREILTIIKKYDLDKEDLDTIEGFLKNCSNNIREIKDILELLGYDYIYKDILNNKKSKFKLNRFQKKMYYRKLNHLRKIKRYMPSWVYGIDFESGKINYWDRHYINDKYLKKCSNKKIRHIEIGEEDFNLKGCSYKQKFNYWGEISDRI
ncbi:hypothetical protein N494_18795 (plasmid) [Clostridium botulinum A2B7 92]|uniref:hypothetical protein n=1 Tax=Clostridium botulinum TaxID=1491 RepID=UPI0007E0EE2F|nr:hypothetical protein [Clostridium botulinum]KEI94160.1 hypothetical protein N494_18795 [Clostridium botulinum A2B7 92]